MDANLFVRVVAVESTSPLPNSLTHQETINQVLHQYPRLGGTLGEVMRRYQELVDMVNGVVPFPGFEPEKIQCPHCGSALIITDQNGTKQHGT